MGFCLLALPLVAFLHAQPAVAPALREDDLHFGDAVLRGAGLKVREYLVDTACPVPGAMDFDRFWSQLPPEKKTACVEKTRAWASRQPQHARAWMLWMTAQSGSNPGLIRGLGPEDLRSVHDWLGPTYHQDVARARQANGAAAGQQAPGACCAKAQEAVSKVSGASFGPGRQATVDLVFAKASHPPAITSANPDVAKVSRQIPYGGLTAQAVRGQALGMKLEVPGLNLNVQGQGRDGRILAAIEADWHSIFSHEQVRKKLAELTGWEGKAEMLAEGVYSYLAGKFEKEFGKTKVEAHRATGRQQPLAGASVSYESKLLQVAAAVEHRQGGSALPSRRAAPGEKTQGTLAVSTAHGPVKLKAEAGSQGQVGLSGKVATRVGSLSAGVQRQESGRAAFRGTLDIPVQRTAKVRADARD